MRYCTPQGLECRAGGKGTAREQVTEVEVAADLVARGPQIRWIVCGCRRLRAKRPSALSEGVSCARTERVRSPDTPDQRQFSQRALHHVALEIGDAADLADRPAFRNILKGFQNCLVSAKPHFPTSPVRHLSPIDQRFASSHSYEHAQE